MLRRLSKKKLAGLIVIALALAVVMLFIRKDTAQAPQPAAPTTCLNIDGRCVELERLETNQQRLKGLSDRDFLSPNTGMLFSYNNPATECMWMKDMRFSIDIIWLDESQVISKIERNVAPETYPQSFCQDNTMYVIELNAGDAERLGLQTGQKLSF